MKIWKDAAQAADYFLLEQNLIIVKSSQESMKGRQRDIQFFCLFEIKMPNQGTTDFYRTSPARAMLIYQNRRELEVQQIYAEAGRIQGV